MSNFIYTHAKQFILDGDIDFKVDNIKIMLVNDLYVQDKDSDSFLSDIPSGARVTNPYSLLNISTNLGVLDGDDVEIPDYNGNPFNAIIIYKDTGNEANSILIVYIDSSPGLPYVGSNPTSIIISWNNGTSKILAL